ncbi:MAG: YrdB family protein [Devosia sp.]
MEVIKGVNLGLAFAVELAMLAGLGIWAFGLSQETWVRWGLVVPVIGVAVALWAVLAAPAAATRLPEPGLTLLKIALFGATTVALAQAGQGFWALVFSVVAAGNLALAALWGQL